MEKCQQTPPRAARLLARLSALTLLCTLPGLAIAQEEPAPSDAPVTIETPGATPAEDRVRMGEKFDDWQIVCEKVEAAPNGEVCASVQEVRNGEKVALWMAIGYFGDQGTPAAIVRVPYDLAGQPLAFTVSQGLGISIDGAEPARFNFELCAPNGCEARLLLDEALISAMKAGSKAGMLVTLGTGQVATINISLKGFTSGLDALPKPAQ